MNKILNIFLITGILFLFVGAVSATDINNPKLPDGWSKVKDGFYKGPQEGMLLSIVEKTDDSWFQNNTDGYTYSETDSGSYVYVDEGMQTFGSFELIKVNGKEYIVDMSDSSANYDRDMDKIAEDFEMFNLLNNITPEQR